MFDDSEQPDCDQAPNSERKRAANKRSARQWTGPRTKALSRKVSSERRIAANRENGAQSKGPTTPRGKRRSALNPLLHGITAKAVLLPGEDLAVFAAALDRAMADFEPVGDLEEWLVRTLVEKRHRRMRCPRAERYEIARATAAAVRATLDDVGGQEEDDDLGDLDDEDEDDEGVADVFVLPVDQLSLIRRYERGLDRDIARLTEDLERLQQRRRQREQCEKQAKRERRRNRVLGRVAGEGASPTGVGLAVSAMSEVREGADRVSEPIASLAAGLGRSIP